METLYKNRSFQKIGRKNFQDGIASAESQMESSGKNRAQKIGRKKSREERLLRRLFNQQCINYQISIKSRSEALRDSFCDRITIIIRSHFTAGNFCFVKSVRKKWSV